MLSFPYQDEPLTGLVPPSLPPGTTVRWRPLVPVRLIGPGGSSRSFTRAVFDPCADDTVFAADLVPLLGIVLRPPAGHVVRWRGQAYTLHFGDVELELTDDSGTVWRWPAVVSFSPAPIRYPILGTCGCLQFFDARFRGKDRVVEIETNSTYPGITA
jgi:hypothetical protein